ncbi:MAG: hypothetical protein OXI19_08055, partial [Gemmatimonadota bacterium]|nr:hypothetical protein [Gemmatimonadota bacterium]
LNHILKIDNRLDGIETNVADQKTSLEGIKEKLDLVSEIASANSESLVHTGETLDRILKILKK